MTKAICSLHSWQKTATLQAGVLVHQPEFLPILDSLGIESVLSPRLTTVGAIHPWSGAAVTL